MLRYTLFLLTTVLFIASLFAVNGYQLPHAQPPQAQAQNITLHSCRVLKIFDGDTFACDLNGNGRLDGKPEHIRLLGIDAPEMHYSRKNKSGEDEPEALAATQWLEQAILNKPVYLEYDREKTDKYHRQLAYVYTDPQKKQMLNEGLLEAGLAHVLFLGINRRHQARLEQAERSAQEAKRGMWQ